MNHKTQGYFSSIAEGFSTLWQSLVVTVRHLYQARRSRKPIGVEDSNYFDQSTGIVTLQYPFESFPIPDNGRYRLHNEIDDCIVCDLCAKICPVDCIDITAVKSTEEIGKTSDGTTKRLYAAEFDIDMAKCCYCGLCTTVCPTECLTMTKTYDYSEFDITKMVYHFTDLSPEQAEEKKAIYEEAQKLKAAAKATVEKPKIADAGPVNSEGNASDKVPFKPIVKPSTNFNDVKKSEEKGSDNQLQFPPNTESVKPKIVFKPKINVPARPIVGSDEKKEITNEATETGNQSSKTDSEIKEGEEGNKQLPSIEATQTPKPKIVFKPKISVPAKNIGAVDKKVEDEKLPEDAGKNSHQELPLAKEGLFKGDFESSSSESSTEEKPQKPKIVFKPKIPGIAKPTSNDIDSNNKAVDLESLENKPAENTIESKGEGEDKSIKDTTPKPPLKPVIKPKIPGLKKPDSNNDEVKN